MQEHTWRTTSSHVTSGGRVRYEHCRCGQWRVVVDEAAAPAWRTVATPGAPDR
ncbi:hypothetical protein ACFPIJ_09265 [Dactylosporangium cerinum]|uniref:Uncharacterized protein n=1 Tax=Dactylosporangium cerinum TaxID=1434730 RepID=A0ABV9VNR0_9ACTN